MPTPASYNIVLYQGDDFSLHFRLRQYVNGVAGSYIDLSGCTPAAEIKDIPGGTVLATFTCTLDNQTTSPGGVTLSLPHATTASLVATTATTMPYWDFQITDAAGLITTYLGGQVSVLAQVTTP